MRERSTLQKQIAWQLAGWILLLVAAGGLATVIILDTIEGWTNDKTITLIYAIVAPSVGVAFYFPLSQFLINRSEKLIHIKTQIYKSLEKVETANELNNLEGMYLSEQAEECVRYINEIFISKGMDTTSLDKIDALFDEFGELKNNEGLRWFEAAVIRHKYKRIKSGYSVEFDELFRSYKNRELIEKPHFPFLEMLLPLAISIIGLFATIYQTLATEGPLANPLLDYIKVFGATILLAGAFALYGLTRGRETAIEKYQKLLDKVQKVASPATNRNRERNRKRKASSRTRAKEKGDSQT